MHVTDSARNDEDATPGANQEDADHAVPEKKSITGHRVEGIEEDSDSHLAAALAYANLGWSVIPADGKRPLIDWKEYQSRRATESEIRAWWKRWPQANVGAVTGEVSGIVVLDVDGDAGIETLKACAFDTGATVQARSGGDGYHFFYAHPGAEVRNFAGGPGNKKLDKVDFRGDGGFIILDPSVHPCGGHYEWRVSPFDCAPVAMPGWLLELVTGSGKESAAEGLPDEIPKGMRNTALTSLAGRLRQSGLHEEAICEALKHENAKRCHPPLPDTEVASIARSIARYEPGGRFFPLTDTGNAERLASTHGGDLLFSHSANRWLVYDGQRWRIDETAEIRRRMIDTVRRIGLEGKSCTDKGIGAALETWARRSESATSLHAGIKIAESLLPITQDELDRDPWLLNVANGTLDLKTGELRAHDRADLVSCMAPVRFDPDARPFRFESFLDEVIVDEKTIDYLQKAIGYCLTGETSEHCFFLLLGAGRNGKSTFLNVLSRILGDYATATGPETFTDRAANRPSNDVARLAGRRVVTTFEPESGSKLTASLIKQLTGGDTITARFLYGEFFTFIPQMKVFMAANAAPRVDASDCALFERVHTIPFDTYVAYEKRDKGLSEKLYSEASGILNWAIEGCLRWQAEGLGIAPGVAAATREYRTSEDRLSGFLEEHCVFEPGEWVGKTEFRDAYTRWCETRGFEPLSDKSLIRTMEAHEILEARSGSRGRYWSGIRLRLTTKLYALAE